MTADTVAPVAGNLIIACIEDHPKAIMLLHMARKRAQETGRKWRAVFVETPSDLQQAQNGGRERMLRLLTLAGQMGGDTVHMEASSIEKGLTSLLEKEGKNISLVIIGSVEGKSWLDRWRTMPWIRTVQTASQYTQVEVVPLSGQPYHRSIAEKLHLHSIRLQDFIYALLAVGVAYLAAFVLESLLPPALFRINEQNVALLFMIACAFAAGRFGLMPGLLASVASFAAVNYTTIAPYHQISIASVTDFLSMGLFLSAALLISLFTSQTRDYGREAGRRELSTQALFTLYRIASEAFSREYALEKLQRKLEHMLEADVAFFLPPTLNPRRIDPAFPPGLKLGEADRKALDGCWNEMKTTGVAAPFNPGTAWRFELMMSPAGEIGVIGVKPRDRTKVDAWFGQMLTAIADQTAGVLEHIELERSMGETRIREEREKLRAMLLSSVSHDFKTPLAGIIGALSVHRSLGEKLMPQKRAELIEAAIEEAQRLDSFITNILDMTRLESGNIQFHQEWHSMDASIKNVLKRLQHRCSKHHVIAHPSLPGIEAYMDAMMIEQVLQNILDNACKYTPADTRIEILCTIGDGNGLICQVRDYGPGLPPEKINHVFDKYARLHKKDTQVAGTGLGLAISKAIMEAQGGWITAANHPDGGAVFTLSLPRWRRVETKRQEPQQDISDAPLKQAHRRH